MSDNFNIYNTKTYSCKHCGWSGYGKEVLQSEILEDGFEFECPRCRVRFPGLVLFSTIAGSLGIKTYEDKLVERAVKSFQDKWTASLLKDISQLPDLQYDIMTFVLREIEEEGEKYIVITCQDKIIWKEILAYEYYERFMELGKLFKQKYGDGMIDLVPDVDGYDLYGDEIHSGIIIENFRKTLRTNSSDNQGN